MIKKKIFKWVGGKVWIKEPLENIINEYCENNESIDTYVEPCAGGLGSFLSMSRTLMEKGIKNIYLNDINKQLIGTFKNLYSKNISLYNQYILIEKEYESRIPKEYIKLTKEMKKEDIKKNLLPAKDFYLSKRLEYNQLKNKTSINGSALFIFLMQHCFNGVYRENNSGEFNTPYNWEPKIANQFVMKNIFEEYKHIFSYFNIEFSSKDAIDFILNLDVDMKKTIVYIDPPYMNKKNNELKYTAGGFTKENQITLLGTIELREINYIIYSNYDFDIFRDFATKNALNVSKLGRKSKINPLNVTEIFELLISRKFN